jgi:hypothetical protein
MKATVIKFFDAEGNEVKNVSTQIVLNGETYVKQDVALKPDYSHLVGMWVKFTALLRCEGMGTIGKWYQCSGIEEMDNTPIIATENNCASRGWKHPEEVFDLSNPLPYNPDTVVGFKEFPNDGKTYAECLEDVELLGEIKMIKGYFYETRNGEIFNHENDNNPSCGFTINGTEKDFTSHFRIHTPTPEPIWKTCRETMWEYNNEMVIYTDRHTPELDESLHKLTKHLNALAYLSEIARRCNGDRVVDWGGGNQLKYTVVRAGGILYQDNCLNVFHQIAFLDQEARDHSFEVDKHIWNDYYGLPNGYQA